MSLFIHVLSLIFHNGIVHSPSATEVKMNRSALDENSSLKILALSFLHCQALALHINNCTIWLCMEYCLAWAGAPNHHLDTWYKLQ